jgi:hypothetical protein
MAVNGVSGSAVAATAAGGLLVWSGIKGANITNDLRGLISGKAPNDANTTNLIGTPSAPTAAPGTTAEGSASIGVQSSALPSAGTYSTAQLESLWVSAGGSSAKAATAACIAMHESGGRPQVTSSNPDGGVNVGLWQLDTKGKGAGYSVLALQNAMNNARITVFASGNGTNWSAWATASMCGV